MSASDYIHPRRFGDYVNQEGAAQPVIPASHLPKVRIKPAMRTVTGADTSRWLDEMANAKGDEVVPMHTRTYEVPVKRGYDDPRLAELQHQIHAKNERNIQRELENGDPNPKPESGTVFHLKPDSDLDAMAQGIQRALDASDALERERDTGKRLGAGEHPLGAGAQYMRNRWHMASDPTRNLTPEGRQRARGYVRKHWERVARQPLACEHGTCPPWAHVERKRTDREPGQ